MLRTPSVSNPALARRAAEPTSTTTAHPTAAATSVDADHDDGADGGGPDGWSRTENAAPVGFASNVRDPARVPNAWDLQLLVAGKGAADDVAKTLRAALLASDPQKVSAALATLQIVESFQRQHRVQKEAFAGTGYDVQPWPGLEVKLSAADAARLAARANDLPSVGAARATQVLAMLHHEGVLSIADAGSAPFGKPRTDDAAYLSGSHGIPAPRGDVRTHKEAWARNVEAAEKIKHVVHEVAAYLAAHPERAADVAQLKAMCPFARGNHAKGVSFDGAKLVADASAPAWVKDLVADARPGRVRISGSQTNPREPDSEAHQTGVRIAIPIGGSLDDPDTPRIDLTANTGAETHADSGLDHVTFTDRFSVPRDGLAHARPLRVAEHLTQGAPIERLHEIKVALGATKQAAKEKFHEHPLFARHAFFVAGKHVQVRFAIEGPRSFADTRNDKDPNADLNEIQRTIARDGLKLAMFIAEVPDGQPEMIEQEAWQDVRWVRAATVELPAQQASSDSAAAKWFEATPHIPAGKNKLFQAEGIGRDRVAVYAASGSVRADWKPGSGLAFDPSYDAAKPRPAGW